MTTEDDLNRNTFLAALRDEEDRTLRKIEQHSRRLARIRADIKAASYPAEPTTANLITFEKQYVAGGKSYDYAALRAEGRWYITGSTAPQALTWRQLIDFIRKDNVAQAIYRVGVTVSSVAC